MLHLAALNRIFHLAPQDSSKFRSLCSSIWSLYNLLLLTLVVLNIWDCSPHGWISENPFLKIILLSYQFTNFQALNCTLSITILSSNHYKHIRIISIKHFEKKKLLLFFFYSREPPSGASRRSGYTREPHYKGCQDSDWVSLQCVTLLTFSMSNGRWFQLDSGWKKEILWITLFSMLRDLLEFEVVILPCTFVCIHIPTELISCEFKCLYLQ